MAVDIYLNIDPIKGESKGSGHKNEIDVLSWSWGGNQPGDFHRGSGGGVGKSTFQDVHFTHYVDQASPDFYKYLATGDTSLKKATITVRKAGKEQLEYWKLTMENVLISSISTGGSSGDERMTEHVSLHFQTFEVSYTLQKDDGGKGETKNFKWNIPEILQV